MPVLHNACGGQGKAPTGQIVTVPPQFVLQHVGPRVQVAIMVPDQIAVALTKQGKPVPPPVAGWGLIDTGAGSSCIDEAAAHTLGLPVINVASLCSASHTGHPANVYPAKVQIANLPMGINASQAIGAPLAAQGLIALLGRDVLAHCILIYNGAVGEFTLCI
jgi:predicted aspartyl protease